MSEFDFPQLAEKLRRAGYDVPNYTDIETTRSEKWRALALLAAEHLVELNPRPDVAVAILRAYDAEIAQTRNDQYVKRGVDEKHNYTPERVIDGLWEEFLKLSNDNDSLRKQITQLSPESMQLIQQIHTLTEQLLQNPK